MLPRTKHVGAINICIDRYDHYCPFLFCVVGEGNYPYFFKFMSLLILFIGLTMGIGIWAYSEGFLHGGLVLLMVCCLLLVVMLIFVLQLRL